MSDARDMLPEESAGSHSLRRHVIVWARDLIISLIVAAVIKFAYRFRFEDIQRGDMVVFRFPHDPSKSYIKRVIGLPGDTIRIERGTVFVNGGRIDEPYVAEDYRDLQSWGPGKAGSDCYFVLGDHRSSSNDSRNWGMVNRDLIYGKAVFIYWPLDRIGPVR